MAHTKAGFGWILVPAAAALLALPAGAQNYPVTPTQRQAAKAKERTEAA